MALHEQSVGATDEWYTPPYVFSALGLRFDLDVSHPGLETLACSVPADNIMTSGGLERPWVGRVWMNPPFGGRGALVPWLQRFMDHGNGICLVPDRTSAPWWWEFADQADAILLVRSKIRFVKPDGTTGKSPAQGTALWAKGAPAVAALHTAEQRGLGRVWVRPN